jgi:DNA segregation ATPase FtsK/SpoIIIE-like protein
VTPYVREDDDPLFRRAAFAVVSAQLGAVTFIQRKVKVSFRDAEYLLDIMTKRGITGPAHGSAARKVNIKQCQQCGRVGKREFIVVPATEHDSFRRATGIDPIWVCKSRSACRSRWTKTNEVDE